MSEKLTVEETIEILCGINCDLCFDETDNPRGNEALDEAIMLLEKRVPMKPKKDEKQVMRYTTVYVCPSCGGVFSGTLSQYCYHCGQALDWSNCNE